jgi:hypothetical protein
MCKISNAAKKAYPKITAHIGKCLATSGIAFKIYQTIATYDSPMLIR